MCERMGGRGTETYAKVLNATSRLWMRQLCMEETLKWGIVFGYPTRLEATYCRQQRLRVKEFSFRKPPHEVFSKLQENHQHTYLLESVEGPRKLANFSFIGFDPQIIITNKNGKTTIANETTGEEIVEETPDPLETLRRLVGEASTSCDQFRLSGGVVGYISYDAIRYWESLPEIADDDLKLPDIEMGVFNDGIIFDHRVKKAYYYFFDEDRSDQLESEVRRPLVEHEDLRYTAPKPNVAKEDFESSVLRAKEYVFNGDIFQVVLSKRYDFRIEGALVDFYRILRRINPSPYMYFLKMGERQIIGSSPEMLVRVEKGAVETYPIAGTRPRVADTRRNKALASELLADPKERAEHIMLVDLARNDIGRISEYGSVEVPEFMTVHRYSHVQHIVSRVSGRLSPRHDSLDALRAMFPAGTVSGAPKVRAMEIIEELEPSRRGPYAGTVGYFSYNGSADFAITIRTLVVDRDKASIQVGAGIVADSDPEREWFETEHKAEALMRSLSRAGEEI